MVKFKIDKKNIIIWTLGMLFSFSAAILASYNIIYKHYSSGNIILTMFTSFVVMFCFFISTAEDTIAYIKKYTYLCAYFYYSFNYII